MAPVRRRLKHSLASHRQGPPRQERGGDPTDQCRGPPRGRTVALVFVFDQAHVETPRRNSRGSKNGIADEDPAKSDKVTIIGMCSGGQRWPNGCSPDGRGPWACAKARLQQRGCHRQRSRWAWINKLANKGVRAAIRKRTRQRRAARTTLAVIQNAKDPFPEYLRIAYLSAGIYAGHAIKSAKYEAVGG